MSDYARRVGTHRKGRRAVHVHISRLSRASQQPNDLRLAAEAFLPLERRYEGQTYRLANHDLVFVGKDVTVAAMDEVVLRLRYMFSDDPLFKTVEQNTDDRFCTYYDMSQDYDAFLAMAENLASGKSIASEPAPDSSVVPFAAAAQPRLEEAARPNLANDIRMEDVFLLGKDGQFTAILSEIHIRLDALRARHHRTVTPSDGWLLTTLAQDLDPAFGEAVQALSGAAAKTLVLKLHPLSVLLPEFDRFAEIYRQVCRLPVVVEMNAWAALGEPDTLFAVQKKLNGAGFRLCLAEWNPYAFAMFDANRIAAHFHKIAWQPQWSGSFREEWRAPLQDAIRRADPAKVILSDCPSLEASAFGHRLGIALYTGPFPTAHAARFRA